jgi:putative spermidine/putrescine transport system permease protein
MVKPTHGVAAPKTANIVPTKSAWRPIGHRWSLLLLLAPGGGYLLLLFGYPLVTAVLSSFGLYTLGQKNELTARHYIDLFANPIYRDGLAITIYIAFSSTLISLVLSIGFAALLRRTFPGRRFFNALYKIPLAVPGIVAGFVVLTMFDRGGIMQRILDPLGVGLPRMVRDPFAIGVLVAIAWKSIPFMTIIVGASLGGISEELIHAARTLGARPLRVLLSIQIPLALPGITAATLLVFISAMGAFAIPNLIGPVYPLPLSVQMYQEGFVKNQWGLVGSMGTLIMIVSCLVLIGYYRATRSLRRFQGESTL